MAIFGDKTTVASIKENVIKAEAIHAQAVADHAAAQEALTLTLGTGGDQEAALERLAKAEQRVEHLTKGLHALDLALVEKQTADYNREMGEAMRKGAAQQAKIVAKGAEAVAALKAAAAESGCDVEGLSLDVLGAFAMAGAEAVSALTEKVKRDDSLASPAAHARRTERARLETEDFFKRNPGGSALRLGYTEAPRDPQANDVVRRPQGWPERGSMDSLAR